MPADVAPLTDQPLTLTPTGTERLRATALGAFTALLGVAFLLLLAADQAYVASGMR